MTERGRFKQIHSLEERLAAEARRLREEAELLPPAQSAMRSCGKPAGLRPVHM